MLGRNLAFIKCSDVLETGLSDYRLIYAAVNTKLMKPKPVCTIRRTCKSFDQKIFLSDLEKVPFSVAYTFDEPEDVYWCWEKLFNQVLDEQAPIRKVKNVRKLTQSS